MAKAKAPSMSDIAAASVGVSVNWFQDKPGPRARSRPSGAARPSPRLTAIRTVNQVVWDRFPLLPAATRRAWRDYARSRPARLGSRWRILPAQLVYTAANILPFDQRGEIYDLPPWGEYPVWPSSLSVQRPGAGLPPVLAASWASPPPAGTFLDVWAVVQVNPDVALRWKPLARHLSYVPAGSGPAALPLPGDRAAIVGVRCVSPRGVAARVFLPFAV